MDKNVLLAAAAGGVAGVGLVGLLVCRALPDPDIDNDVMVKPGLLYLIGSWLEHKARALANRLLPPQMRIYGIMFSFIHSKVVYSLTKLGIPDALHDGPRSVADMAKEKGVKADSLARLLRMANALGLFKQVSPGVWSNNRLSGVLRTSHPGSLVATSLHWGDESYRGHELMYEALAEGSDIAWVQKHGEDYWTWLSRPENAEIEERFNQAMVSASAPLMPSVVNEYNWGRHAGKVIVDVGGGTGGALSIILAARPDLKGVLFDMPGVIQQARKQWAQDHPDLLPRATFVGGSMFDEVPSGNVFFLKWIIHDWNDAASIRILKTVRAAVEPGNETDTTLLLCDCVVDEACPNLAIATLDMQMLSLVDGKERSIAEWESLLGATGWHLRKVHRLKSLPSLLEAVPVPVPVPAPVPA